MRAGRAGRRQLHEGEEAERLRLLRHQLHQSGPEPPRLLEDFRTREPVALARRVTLVEDEVDDREDGADACR